MTYCTECGMEIKDSVNYCPGCGNEIGETPKSIQGDSTDSPNREAWNPKLPVTSVFFAILLMWGALWSLSNSAAPIQGLLILGVPAILIIPRVRRIIIQFLLDDGLDPEDNRELWVLIALTTISIYGFLGLAASMLVVGAAVSDPTMQNAAGFVSLGLMYLTAIVIVYGIRIARRLQHNPT